jgi:hypothetical protein
MNPCHHAALIRQFSDEFQKLAEETEAGCFATERFATLLHDSLGILGLEMGVASLALKSITTDSDKQGSPGELRFCVRDWCHLSRRWRVLGESFRREFLHVAARCCTALEADWRDSRTDAEGDFGSWDREASALAQWTYCQFRRLALGHLSA